MPRLLLVSLLACLVLVPAASARSPRIWNGTETTTAAQYPWSVALVDPGLPNRAFCGGTLIAPSIVLTAAHCTIGSRAAEIGVVAGLRDITPVTTTAHPNYRAVTRISLHPDAVVEDLQLRRDLSILTLASPVPAPAAAVPVGTAADIADGADVVATGWGTTEPTGPGADDTVKIKRVVTVDLVSDTTCAGQYDTPFGAFVFSPADQVCATRDDDGDPETPADNRDTCAGDSGGPLVRGVVGADPTDPADWELVGTTSWGIGCAEPDADNPALLYPGVYARTAGAQLRPYAVSAAGGTDPNPAQPQYAGGDPAVAADATSIACSSGDVVWTGGVEQVDYLVRRVTDDGYETVSDIGFHAFDAGDAGDDFVCELRGKNPAAGGYGLVRSDVVTAPTPPPAAPTVVTVPGPVQTVPVPGPTVVQPQPFPVAVPVPAPRVDDTRAPSIRRVTRSCTKARRCTFTVTATDAAPSSGVAALSAYATTIRARSCRKGGRRTVCASVTQRDLTVRRTRSGAFTVSTPRPLPRGTHQLVLVASDANGNVMARPYRIAFKVA